MGAPVAEAGLILDIAGAWALASALVLKRPSQILDESINDYWGGDPRLARSLAEQTADAQPGAALLTLGFVGQFAASAGWSPSWATTWVMIMAALAVVAAA